MENDPSAHLIVIGASAGGVDALSRLAATLPEDFPAPIVAAQHLSPDRESHLEEILARKSALPVKTVTDHEKLQPGTLFVVPADHHVNITDQTIDLHIDNHGRPKPSIDLLMSSAAQVFGERLISIVLSGTGSDGAEGARAVKRAGGTVIIQDPETAEFPGMPRSLAPNTVDIVAQLEDMGQILKELLAGDAISGEKEDEEEPLEEFLDELRQRHGLDFTSYKEPTIRRRLQRRFAATGTDSLEEYRNYLAENSSEYGNLVNAFLIKVTEFFRDPEQFDYLRDEVLPGLIERVRDQGEQLRVWSAGCATGEEAYSLAILISEALGSEAGNFNVRIFATDLDASAVNFARRGVYPPSALAGLSNEQIKRHFVEEDGHYQVKKSIRSMIVFGEHDLVQRSPFPQVDLVVSRNVLIYFTSALQRRTLQLFAYSLKDGAYLMLGKAETTSPLSDYFDPVDRQRKLYRRQGERFVMPVANVTEPVPEPPRSPQRRRSFYRGVRASGNGQRAAVTEESVLNRIPVGIVGVDRRYDIHTINNAARRLLSIHSTAIGEDLLHLIRDVPYEELRNAIDAAFRDGEATATGEFAVGDTINGDTRYLEIVCNPRREGEEPGPVSVVDIVITDVTNSAEQRRKLEKSLQDTRSQLEEYRREAEEESARLEQQNSRLIEANRQLEASNRELTGLNEDLQATNEENLLSTEEAQAATEEVETLNEELQATNEELETLNEELQATVEELNTTNEDLYSRSSEMHDLARNSDEEKARLQAILEHVPDPVLVVSAKGEIVLTNEEYEQVFDGGDFMPCNREGSPLSEDEKPQIRAARGETFTTQFALKDENGKVAQWYEAKAKPVSDEHRQGGVIVLRKILGDA